MLNFLKKENKFNTFLFCLSLLFFGVYCFCIFAFSSYFPGNIITIIVCVVMCATMLLYSLRKKSIKINFLLPALIILNVLILVSDVINFNLENFTKRFVLVSATSFVIYLFGLSDEENPNILLKVALVSLIIFSVYYVFYYNVELLNLGNSFIRLGSKFDNQNGAARPFVFGFLFSFYNLLRKKLKIVSIFLCLIFIILCLTTGSISNLLSLIICVLVMLFVESSKKSKIISIIGIIIFGIVFLILLSMPQFEYFKRRITNMLNVLMGKSSDSSNTDYSLVNRFSYALLAFKIFAEYPFFGSGTNVIVNYTSGNGSYSHNNIAEILSSYGIIFFVLFELLLLFCICKKSKINKKLQIPLVLYMILFQFFLVTYYLKIDMLLIGIFFSSFSNSSFLEISFRQNKIRISHIATKENFKEIKI